MPVHFLAAAAGGAAEHAPSSPGHAPAEEGRGLASGRLHPALSCKEPPAGVSGPCCNQHVEREDLADLGVRNRRCARPMACIGHLNLYGSVMCCPKVRRTCSSRNWPCSLRRLAILATQQKQATCREGSVSVHALHDMPCQSTQVTVQVIKRQHKVTHRHWVALVWVDSLGAPSGRG